MKKATVSAGGSIVSAILASMCCIGPFIVGLAGIGSIGAFVVLEQYRTLLIAVAGVLIALGFYLAYRRQEVQCEDGTCKIESSSRGTKLSVWGATVVATLAMAFPYFGLSPSVALSKPFATTPLGSADSVTFFHVPLVCNVAPHLGCGSRAKFIMLDLMKHESVTEAWLSRKGTALAVVWNKAANADSRAQALKSVFSLHNLQIEQTAEEEQKTLAANFRKTDEWFKGSEVDKLSLEEAEVIADQILAKVTMHVRFKGSRDKLAFHTDVRQIIERCFLSIKSYTELNETMNKNIWVQVVRAGEKYVGAGNMPDPKLLQNPSCEHSDHNGACCTNGAEKQDACCTPGTQDKNE